MHKRLPCAFLFACLVAFTVQHLVAQSTGLRIVVIAGEGAVNIIQQKTAVAPIVEVRDANNVPVAGASVTFRIGGQGASFASSGSTLTVTTNGAGQATAAGFTPSAAGTVQINVTAAFKGLTAAATTITQTVFATAAQAAAAGAGAAGASGAGAAGGAAAGGGISMMTIGLVGAAVAGGAVVATQTGLVGGGAEGFVHILGQVYATAVFGPGPCNGVRGEGGASNTCYLNPVSGATVSTSLDGATTSTDTAGNFDLTTTIPRSKIGDCMTYTLAITAAGHPNYSINVSGFSGNEQPGTEHRQLFALSPPTPNFMGGC
jgi:hypothetical protein